MKRLRRMEMNRQYFNELIITTRILLGAFTLMLISANLYYNASPVSWGRTAAILLVVIFAFLYKPKQIYKDRKNLDERAQLISYRAVTIGFYAVMLAVLWFAASEIAVNGKVSVRSQIELIAGVVGASLAYSYFDKRY
jgi:hypothetical protein